MPALRREDGRVLCIGHRGAPRQAPENTIASFRAAVTAGVDLVELDIDALADGTLVVAHSLDPAELGARPGSGEGPPATVASLRAIAPEVPTLDEALAFFAEEARSVGIHLDLKAVPHATPMAERVVAHGLEARTVVSSTEAVALHDVASVANAIGRGLTYPHDRHGVSRRPSLAPLVAGGLRAARAAAPLRIPARAARAGAHAAFVHHRVVTAALVARLRSRGIVTLAWTVDDPGEVRRVVEAGVAGVISNDPSMVLATLSS